MGAGPGGGRRRARRKGSLPTPEVGRAQVGGIGCAAEEVLDGMVGCVAPRAQWGGQSPNPVGIISHG